jgi:hypothetical protein
MAVQRPDHQTVSHARMCPPINARTHCIKPRVAPRDQGPSTISRYLGTRPIVQERGLRSNVEVRCFLRQPTACPLIRIRLQSRTQLDHVLDKGRPGSGAVLHARAWNDRNRNAPTACCFVVALISTPALPTALHRLPAPMRPASVYSSAAQSHRTYHTCQQRMVGPASLCFVSLLTMAGNLLPLCSARLLCTLTDANLMHRVSCTICFENGTTVHCSLNAQRYGVPDCRLHCTYYYLLLRSRFWDEPRTEIKCTRPGVVSTTAVFDSLVDGSERVMHGDRPGRAVVPRTLSGIQSLKSARLHQRWLRLGAVAGSEPEQLPSQR